MNHGYMLKCLTHSSCGSDAKKIIIMKYILVQWPESQYLMDHERFHECLLVQDIDGHDEVGSSAYMCPEDLYCKVYIRDVSKYLEQNSKEDYIKGLIEKAPPFINKEGLCSWFKQIYKDAYLQALIDRL